MTAKDPSRKFTLPEIKQYKHGDMQIISGTIADADWLRSNPRWLMDLGTGVRIAKYCVLVQDSPVKEADMAHKARIKRNLVTDNVDNLPGIEVEDVRWQTPPKKKQKHASMVVELATAPQANDAIQYHAFWGTELKTVVKYDESCKILQCFKCWKYGHLEIECREQQICGNCATNHTRKRCLSGLKCGLVPNLTQHGMRNVSSERENR